eukprot:1339664-Alexandrium_andersonii.AAC.1
MGTSGEVTYRVNLNAQRNSKTRTSRQISAIGAAESIKRVKSERQIWARFEGLAAQRCKRRGLQEPRDYKRVRSPQSTWTRRRFWHAHMWALRLT